MIRRYKSNLLRRKSRIRAQIKNTRWGMPRLSVFRSNKYIYGQIIDLTKQGKILATASDHEIKEQGTKLEKAAQVGKILAKKAIKKGIKKVVFDRSGYKFHGRVKALAESARKEGLKF